MKREVELLVDKETGKAYASVKATKRVLKSASKRYMQEAENALLALVQERLDESDCVINVREMHRINKVQKNLLNEHLDWLLRMLDQAVADTQADESKKAE